MNDFLPVILAFAGGIFPVLAWLWFWHREDKANPEPKRLIALAFFAGMLTVAIVIPIQKWVAPMIVGGMLTFVAWSFIEEIVKFVSARVTVLGRREADEPIDMVVYMVTVALGFAAIENALFMLSPMAGDNVWQTILTGNLRFVGATLVHVLSSAVVGIALALSFYKPRIVRGFYALGGVLGASLIHSGFNVLILKTPDEHVFRTFAIVWIGVVIVLAVIEYIKRLKR